MLLLMLFMLSADVSFADTTFTHTLSWKMPLAGKPSPRTIEAVWDGASLGGPTPSDKLLSEVNINSKDVVRINMPAFNDSKLDAFFQQQPPYMYSRYIVNWYDKGARLHFFRDGKEYPVHTLSFSGYGHLNEETMLPLHLFFDGRDLGLMDSSIKTLDDHQWEKDTVLQILPVHSKTIDQVPFPDPMHDPLLSLLHPLIDFERRITSQHGVAVEELSGRN